MSAVPQKTEEAPKKRLGDQLIDAGLITQDQLKIALMEQRAKNRPVGQILVDLGFVSDEIIRDVLSSSLGQDSIDLKNIMVDNDVLEMFGQNLARRLKVIPLSFDAEKNTLDVAISDTYDLIKLDRIRASIGKGINIQALMAAQNQIEDALDRLFGFDLSIDSILQEIESEKNDFSDYHGEDAE